jgi:hypothetical protein
MALPPDRPADDAVPQAHAPLPPGLLAAVADQENRWRDIDRRYGLCSSADVAALVGSTARNRSEYASNLRAKGQVLGRGPPRPVRLPGVPVQRGSPYRRSMSRQRVS